MLSAPQFRDIVVSVARKTDAAMWPALFQAVGAPSELLDDLIDAGALASAACCLLIVDRIEGSAIAHSSALRLIRVSAHLLQADFIHICRVAYVQDMHARDILLLHTSLCYVPCGLIEEIACTCEHPGKASWAHNHPPAVPLSHASCMAS